MTQAFRAISINLILLIAAVLTSLTAFGFAWSTYLNQISNAHRDMENHAVALSRHAEQVFSGVEQHLVELSDHLPKEKQLFTGSQVGFQHQLESTFEHSHNVSNFQILDSTGRQIAFSGRPLFPSQVHVEQNYFKTHAAQHSHSVYVGFARYDPQTKNSFIPISLAILSPKNQFLGVLVAWLNTHYFVDLYQALNFGDEDIIAILRQDGWIVARTPMDPKMLEHNFIQAPTFQHLKSSPQGVFEDVYIHDNKVRITGFKNIERYGLTLIAGRDKAELTLPWRNMMKILIFTVLAILVAFFIAAKALSFYMRGKETAEAKFHQTEERFRHFAETASDWLWEMDADLRIVYVSQTTDDLEFDLQRTIGKTRADIIGEGINQQHWQDHLADMKAHRPFSDFEYPIKIDDDSPLRHVRISGAPIFSPDGEFLGYRGTGTDITNSLKTKQQLVEANKTLSQTIETERVLFNIASISLGEGSLDVLLSEVLDQILSIRSFALENKGCIFTVDPETNELVLRAERNLPDILQKKCSRVPSGYCLCGKAMERMEVVFENHLTDEHEVRYQNIKDHGHYIIPIKNKNVLLGILNLYVSAGHSYSDKEVMTLTAVADTIAGIITRREFEDHLIRAQIDAEQSAQAKSDFLSSMSHELRTPLNAILGFAQILQLTAAEKLSDAEAGYLKDIESGGQYLLELIEQVLQYQRIAFGDVPLKIESIQLSDLVNHCMRVIEIRARDAHVQVINQIQTEGLPAIMTDRLRMIQVILNLLMNAIKYNDKGGIVEIFAEPVADKYLRLHIKDNGCGIPVEKHEDLFKPFNRLGREALAIGGAGVGLTVSQQLMEILGGRIGFQSEVAVGSTFWVDIPIEH